MTAKVTETRLPGIGTRFTLRCSDGERISVVLRNDGTSELYTWADDKREGDPPSAAIDLDLDETRQLSAILCGAYARPTPVEELEYARGELEIAWTAVPDGSPAIGRAVADVTPDGVTVVAIQREPAPIIGAGPSETIQAGDTLVTASKRGDVAAFRGGF